MVSKSLLTAVALLLGATTLSLAQSQPNCGAGGPGAGDTYGKPFSGTLQSRAGAERCRAWLGYRGSYRPYRGYRYYRYGY